MAVLVNRIVLIITIFFTIGSSIYASTGNELLSNDLADLPTENQCLDILNKFYINAEKSYGYDNLPDDLIPYLNYADGKKIEELASVLRVNLLLNYLDYPALLAFFNTPELKKQCSEIITKTHLVCRAYCLFISDFKDYIDHYQDDLTWHARFGITGIYAQVETLQTESVLFRTADMYFQTLFGVQSPDDGTTKIQLADSSLPADLIEAYNKTKSTEYLIWLLRYSDISEKKLNAQKITELVNSHLSGDTPYADSLELAFLKLQYDYKYENITADKALEQVDILTDSFAKLPDTTIETKVKLLLRMVLFEAGLCRDYLNTTGTTKDETAIVTTGNCLKTMLAKTEPYRDLSQRVRLVAVLKARSLLKDIAGQAWSEQLKSWDKNLLIDLAASYQTNENIDYTAALNVYKAIELAGVKNDQISAIMLYQRSLCYLASVQDQSDSKIMATARLNSAKDLIWLFTDCPASAPSIPDKNRLFDMLISLCQQIALDPEMLEELTNALKPLVGSVVDGKLMPGTLSLEQIPTELLYIYASGHELTQKFAQATVLYQSIKSGKLVNQAEFRRVYCLYKSGNIAPQTGDFTKNIIIPLQKLLTQPGIEPETLRQAAELLAGICIGNDLEQEIYLSTISASLNALDAGQAEYLVKAVQSFLIRFEPQIQHLAAEGQTEKLAAYCQRLIPLALLMTKKSGVDNIKVSNDIYAGLLVYQFSCSAETGASQPLTDSAVAELNGLNLAESNTVNSIRARAFLAYHQKQYSQARGLWQKVRQARPDTADYFYWEARFWGLFCLTLEPQGKEQARHAVEVLKAELAPQTPEKSSLWQDLWLERIEKLEYNAGLIETGR